MRSMLPVGLRISILSFNNVPLPDSLIEALVDHPELFPDGILVRWTQEQDLIFEATLGERESGLQPRLDKAMLTGWVINRQTENADM